MNAYHYSYDEVWTSHTDLPTDTAIYRDIWVCKVFRRRRVRGVDRGHRLICGGDALLPSLEAAIVINIDASATCGLTVCVCEMPSAAYYYSLIRILQTMRQSYRAGTGHNGRYFRRLSSANSGGILRSCGDGLLRSVSIGCGGPNCVPFHAESNTTSN